MKPQFVPKKLYYRIGEVCDIVGVEAHVLRYWENEFPSLAPPKNRGGHRTYRAKDIELLLTIRNLLYHEGYTIAGARKKLVRSSHPVEDPAHSQKEPDSEPRPAPPAQRLNLVREELENILTLLERE
jgi:DNA-binding transcriptional MerR regulator